MSERDFQSHVVDSLARLETEMVAVEEQTTKTNGRVGKHDELIASLLQRQAERQNACPLVDEVYERLKPLEDAQVRIEAEDKTSGRWLDRLWPFICAAAGALGLLLMQHAQQLLK